LAFAEDDWVNSVSVSRPRWTWSSKPLNRGRVGLVVLHLLPSVLSAQRVAACSVRSLPPLRTAGGDFVFLTRATGARLNGDLVLLGSPAYIRPATPVSASTSLRIARDSAWRWSLAGIALERTGGIRPIARPSASPAFDLPRLAVRADTARVLWGERNFTPGREAFTTAIWYAPLVRGAWGPAERLVAAQQLYWHTSAQAVLRANGDTLRVAVAAFDSARGGGGIVLLSRVGGTWRTRWLEERGMPSYASLAVLDGKTQALSLVEFDPSPGKPGAHLWVRRSLDGGHTWRERTLVDWLRTGMAHEPWLLPLGGPRLALLWGTRPADKTFSTRLLLARSDDAGATWRRTDSLDVGDGFLDLQAVVDSDGRIHALVWEPSGPRRLHHVLWDSRGRRSLRTVASGVAAGFSMLAADDEVQTLWQDAPTSPTDTALRPLYRARLPICPSGADERP
jgi:hypothetical protein